MDLRGSWRPLAREVVTRYSHDRQTSAKCALPGTSTRLPRPSGCALSRLRKQADSSYSGAPPNDAILAPAWKSNDEQARTRVGVRCGAEPRSRAWKSDPAPAAPNAERMLLSFQDKKGIQTAERNSLQQGKEQGAKGDAAQSLSPGRRGVCDLERALASSPRNSYRHWASADKTGTSTSGWVVAATNDTKHHATPSHARLALPSPMCCMTQETNFALQLKGWRENMENFCGSKPPEGGCGSRQAQGFYPLWQPTASVFHGNRRFADCDPIAQFDRFDPRTTIGLPLEVRAVSRALDFLIPVSEALPQRGTRDSNPQPRVPTRSQNRKRPNAQSHRANGEVQLIVSIPDVLDYHNGIKNKIVCNYQGDDSYGIRVKK
ncbi:Lipoprotein signal peptidase [Frankliniella fusca]|uniref:Lipoprotein signal peptidase n=1 Tax=Frankliniella fusca TaxID=407009 RepID=A0AAE1GTW1_9NEOP|nr:Lipoprotein signal peptidase [Frankliniella fusca]